MALQTPRQRLQRPSYGSAEKVLQQQQQQQSSLSASTAVNHKASLRALTGQADPKTPSAATPKMDGAELEVGDVVNVPGEMYGTVKFIGHVRGKHGRFVGVELDRDFAARGKNDGVVDGVHYFTTSVPGAGIFLPIHRAEKRFSPSLSTDSFPTTPYTPSYSTLNGQRARGGGAAAVAGEEAISYTPPTPALPSKFSQSVGPGARPSSPQFKPKRPSLPRPESPLRRQPPHLAPTPARMLSQSQLGARPTTTPTPSKNNLKASTSGRSAQTPRPYSRTGSRLGHRPEVVTEEDRTPVGVATTTAATRTTSTGSVPSFSQPLRSPSRLGSAGGGQQQEAEVQRLQAQLAERDKRLDEQAASLAEMEASVKELSALIPADGTTPGASSRQSAVSDDDPAPASQLRQMLREKNEKISLLTQEFDNHRADFRSTLDSLEMASTETERVYEEQKRDLLAQIAELQDVHARKEDFDGVARQLKQLEELVQELEEGLEESRRGEAEARGEVEFLRGEVERGRSELSREREKAAAAAVMKGNQAVSSPKELEARDDEIRGLKAIIHGLSSGGHASTTTGVNGTESYITDADEVKRLQIELEEREKEKRELDLELERLRRDVPLALPNGHSHTRNESERTATGPPESRSMSSRRMRADTLKPTFAEHARRSGLDEEVPAAGGDHHDRDDDDEVARAQHNSAEAAGAVYCEMCESGDHDTLECTKLQGGGGGGGGDANGRLPIRQQQDAERTHSIGKENEANGVGTGKAVGGVADEDKWCALCEKDGHLAFDCPEEQY